MTPGHSNGEGGEARPFRAESITGTNPDVHRRHCTIVQRADGWGWARQREGVIYAA